MKQKKSAPERVCEAEKSAPDRVCVKQKKSAPRESVKQKKSALEGEREKECVEQEKSAPTQRRDSRGKANDVLDVTWRDTSTCRVSGSHFT